MKGLEINLNFHIESTGSPNQQECDFGERKHFSFLALKCVHTFFSFNCARIFSGIQTSEISSTPVTAAQVHLNRNY